MTTAQKIISASVVLAILCAGAYKVQRTSHQKPSVQVYSPEAASVGMAPRSESLTRPLLQKLPYTSGLAFKTTRGSSPDKPSAARPFTSTQIYTVLKSKAPQLSRSQIESPLHAKGRTADALLAGFRTSTDRRYLSEAMKSFPQDPNVAFEAATANGVSISEQRHSLDAFKRAAPDNSLADYLSAEAHFKAGQPAQALQDLAAASSKKDFSDYTAERVNTDEEAYLAANYPPGEAKLIANAFISTSHLLQLKDLGQEIVGLSNAYAQSGEPNSRDSMLQTAMNLGRRLDEPSPSEPLSSQLIGINIERTALNAMDPSAQYDSTGQTVQQRLELLSARKESIHVLTQQADPLWPALSDQQWSDYHTQLASSGEELALHWLINSFGNH